jgi:ABC-type uncharacterized transport system ATPase subunit
MTEFNNYVELDLDDGAQPGGLIGPMAEKVSVHRFEVMEPSLYDIFIDTAKVDPAELEAGTGGAA